MSYVDPAHYESAFEDALRAAGWPYVRVDEQKRGIFGGTSVKSFDFLVHTHGGGGWLVDVKGRKFPSTSANPEGAVSRSADKTSRFEERTVDVIGACRAVRAAPFAPEATESSDGPGAPDAPDAPLDAAFADIPRHGPLWENWVTDDDLAGMAAWEQAFGQGFQARFVFVYWLTRPSPGAPFGPVHVFRGRAYAFLSIPASIYGHKSRLRSPKWRTRFMPAATFRQIAEPVFGVESKPLPAVV